jgi:hypothetical protein
LANILYAAIELGVGAATIYNYASRDDIGRLAASATSAPRRSWRTRVRCGRRHAEYLFEFLLAEQTQAPAALDLRLNWTTRSVFWRPWQGVASAHPRATRSSSAMNDVVFGAVLRAAHVRAMRAKAYGH